MGNPFPDRVRVPRQGESHLGGRPALRQEPERVPTLTLARRWRTIHPLAYLMGIQLQLLQQSVHRRASPRPTVTKILPHNPVAFILALV